jgi:hypothetical protein
METKYFVSYHFASDNGDNGFGNTCITTNFVGKNEEKLVQSIEADLREKSVNGIKGNYVILYYKEIK